MWQADGAEAGVVLITTLLLITLLLAVAAGALLLSRTDLLISRNLLTSAQALGLAQTGTEMGKNWLEENLAGASLPITLGPEELSDGTYTVRIAALGNAEYQLTASGAGAEGSRRVVEEVVRLPDFTPDGVVTSDGDGLHPDFDDHSGGIGRRIPDFSVDGRNHAPDGMLSTRCPSVSPFATTQAVAQDDLIAAANTLKREVVTRANSFCQADGSSLAGPCTPGLSWVRGTGLTPRFLTGTCLATTPSCFLNLDLSAVALRAGGFPVSVHLPTAPEDRGPFAPIPGASLVLLLSAAERVRLQTAIDDILQRTAELPEPKVLHISRSLGGGSYTYGTWNEPKVTQVEDGADALDMGGGAEVNGAGVLIIPRVVRLRNVRFNWQGVVLVVGDGDLRVEEANTCGHILGAVVVRDDAAPDRKLDLDLVRQSGGCPPLAVNYSCETVSRALTLFMRTVSWTEKFGE
ncbi:MAG TPA: hypothetical protein VGX03_00360 [Candidatus Binatia bacterium]|jgi:hypothetical protein|nr:hypothetical protein [Candidatus Binatia bacterium]